MHVELTRGHNRGGAGFRECSVGLENAQACGNQRDQQLQSHCAHVGDVEVARDMYHFTPGKRRGT